MNHEEAIEIIERIERVFDVNSIRYKGLKLWPFIRLRLWQQLRHPEMNFTSLSSHRNVEVSLSTRLTRIAKAPLRILKAGSRCLTKRRSYQRQLASLHRIGTVDTLFFSRPEEHTDQIGGRFYNPYVDPMIDLVREQHSVLKIELRSAKGQATLPRFEPTVFVSPADYLTKDRLPRRFRRLHNIDAIEGFGDLEQIVLEITGHVQLDERYFVAQAQQLEQYTAFFEDVLSEIYPRAVFLVCYYYSIAMALIWACKKLGLVTVDIQHGRVGEYHGLYARWTRIPQEGYELLPDFFWTWGQGSKNSIEKWQPPRCHHHRPVVGGNRWLPKWIEGDGFGIDGEAEAFYEHLQHMDKVILVSLQPLDDPLPTHILDAMRLSPDNWLWLIRLHPNQRAQQEKIGDALKQSGVSNFEIKNATYLPLYASLRLSDHHVTCYSSVCYEALAFNVPTTIVHPRGLQIYESYIKQGIFAYAQSGDALLAAIGQDYSSEQLREQVPYIETSRQKAEEAIKTILGEPAGD